MYTLTEAAVLLGKKRSALAKRAERGALPTVLKEGQHYITDDILHGLLGHKAHLGSVDSLKEKWIKEMAAGIHTGKPSSPAYQEYLSHGFERFFKHSGLPRELSSITAENIKQSFLKLAPDYEKKKCHFSTKQSIKVAFVSFVRLLVNEGLKTELDLAQIKAVKIKRLFPPRQTVLTQAELDALIARNCLMKGKAEFDVQLSKMIIYLGVMLGLRRSEMIKLNCFDIKMNENRIIVRDAKGQKTRETGFNEEFKQQVIEWKKWRIGRAEDDAFLVMADGARITESAIRHRIRRLSKALGIDLTPHGLRITFASINVNEKGMPITYAGTVLGHNDLKTTQHYTKVSSRAAVDWMKEH